MKSIKGVVCHDVSFSWSGQTVDPVGVLRNVSLAVYPGEIVSVIGPTGAGKSTLLRIMMGLTRPSSGSVTLDGTVIEGPVQRMGIVFQDHGLFPWLNVQQNVEFGMKMRRVSGVERQREASRILTSVGLQDDGFRYPHELSGGMKRRVAVARLLANDAEYLLMDEPFESLDYQTRLRMQQFLLSIHEKFNKSILLVTHQVDEAILLSDRILLMSSKPGRIVENLDISLGRPRDFRGEGFNRYRALITSHLEREVEGLFAR